MRSESAGNIGYAGLLLWVLLVSCAGHVDLQHLAKTPDELVALQQFKADHPEADREDLTMALEVYRAARLRKQALAVHYRHQYPNATPEELDTLIEDQMTREGPYPGAMPMGCANAGSGPMTNTSCN
ncbi:hypothetical protein [Nitrospira sp. Nam80]